MSSEPMVDTSKMRNAISFFIITVCLIAIPALTGQEISVAPGAAAFEGSVAQATTLTFNVHVRDAEGYPTSLSEQIAISVTVSGWSDEVSDLSVTTANAGWTLPQGFSGGQRTIDVAALGPPPPAPVMASLDLTWAIGLGDPQDVSFTFVIRPGSPDGDSAAIDFLIPRGMGTSHAPNYNSGGVRPVELFRDFGEVQAVGVLNVSHGQAQTIADSLQLRVVEVVGSEEVATSAILCANAGFTVIDADDNGKVECVQTVFNLVAPQSLVIAPGGMRQFVLYARRTDLNPVTDTRLAELRVMAREFTSNGFVALDSETFSAVFERRQSPPLNPTIKLYKNDSLLPEAVQATVVMAPGGGNGYPDPQSGLFDLCWYADVDWAALKQNTAVQAGDVIRVELTFPGGSVPSISATIEVIQSGTLSLSYRKVEDLAGDVYDNGRSEKDYLDKLLDDLKAEGLRFKDGGMHFPGGFVGPEHSHPNWQYIADKNDRVREACDRFKKSERKKQGTDQVEGRTNWEIDVFLPFDDGNGGTIHVRVRIRMGDSGQSVKVNDSDPHPVARNDAAKKGAPFIGIALGGDGKPATASTGGTKGGDADVDLKRRGSIGIALGGSGGKGEEGSPNKDGKPGGSGGHAAVKVDTASDQSDRAPAEGVSLGGHGGDSRGQGGNGGDSKVEAKRGSDAKIAGQAGITGDSKFPPGGSNKAPRTGEVRVRHDDGAENGRNARVPAIESNGQSGRGIGGMAVGQPKQPVKGTDPSWKPGAPRTGN